MGKMDFQFPVPVRSIRIGYTILACINVFIITVFLALIHLDEPPWLLAILTGQLDLGREGVAAVWYAGILLFFTGLAALWCFRLESDAAPETPSRGFLRYGWLFIGAAFVFFSLDEMGSLHERVELILPAAYTRGRTGWVTLLWPVMLVVFAYFFWFFWARLSRVRISRILSLAGGILLISIPVQEKLEFTFSRLEGLQYRYLRILEEGCEIFGVLLILIAFLEYAINVFSYNKTGCQRVFMDGGQKVVGVFFEESTIRVFYVILVITAAASLLTAWFFVPHLDDIGRRGDPSAWYPSMALLLAAMLALLNGFLTGSKGKGTGAPTSQEMWVVFAAASLWFSMDFQAGLSQLTFGQLEKVIQGIGLGAPEGGIFRAFALLLSIGLLVCGLLYRWTSSFSRILCIVSAILVGVASGVGSWHFLEIVRVLVPTILLVCFMEEMKGLYRLRAVS